MIFQHKLLTKFHPYVCAHTYAYGETHITLYSLPRVSSCESTEHTWLHVDETILKYVIFLSLLWRIHSEMSKV